MLYYLEESHNAHPTLKEKGVMFYHLEDKLDQLQKMEFFCMGDWSLVHIYLLTHLLVSVIIILYFWLNDAFHLQKKINIVQTLSK